MPTLCAVSPEVLNKLADQFTTSKALQSQGHDKSVTLNHIMQVLDDKAHIFCLQLGL